MKVSIIIPAKNEQGCIGRVLREMPRDAVTEIIIIEGQSTDNTYAEAKKRLDANGGFVRKVLQ